MAVIPLTRMLRSVEQSWPGVITLDLVGEDEAPSPDPWLGLTSSTPALTRRGLTGDVVA